MGENLYVSRDYTFDKINDGTKSQTFTTIAQKSATLLLCRICFTHRLLLTSLQTVNIFQFSEKTCLAHISKVVSGNSVASEPISSTKLMYVCLCVFFGYDFANGTKLFRSSLVSPWCWLWLSASVYVLRMEHVGVYVYNVYVRVMQIDGFLPTPYTLDPIPFSNKNKIFETKSLPLQLNK